MKICKEAMGIKGDEWVLFNDVLNELSSTSKNKDLIDRFHNFLVSTLEQDEIRKQKSWERIKKKRELDPNYARSKKDSKESNIDMSKEEILKESLTFNEAFKQLRSCEDEKCVGGECKNKASMKPKQLKESKWNRETSTISDDDFPIEQEIVVKDLDGQEISRYNEEDDFLFFHDLTDKEIVDELISRHGKDITIAKVYLGKPTKSETLYDKDYMYDRFTKDEVELNEMAQSKEDDGLQPAQKLLKPAMKDFADRHEKAGKKVPKYIKDYVNNKKKGEK